jgi:uncharacterized membrane protein YqjE
MIDTAAAAGAADPPPSLLALLQQLWRELPGLFNDRVELLSLELQRARTVLMQIVVLVFAIAILGSMAWLALWVAIVLALVGEGLPVLLALLAALLANGAAALWAMARARRVLPLLSLPATRRHMIISPSSTSPTPPGSAGVLPDERAG